MNFVKCTTIDDTTVFINLDHVESIYVTKEKHTRMGAANSEAYWDVKESPKDILHPAAEVERLVEAAEEAILWLDDVCDESSEYATEPGTTFLLKFKAALAAVRGEP
jgi:hypothetical protein